jgi:hypothetical protein
MRAIGRLDSSSRFDSEDLRLGYTENLSDIPLDGVRAAHIESESGRAGSFYERPTPEDSEVLEANRLKSHRINLAML